MGMVTAGALALDRLLAAIGFDSESAIDLAGDAEQFLYFLTRYQPELSHKVARPSLLQGVGDKDAQALPADKLARLQ